MLPVRKVLVANRGEIAVRVARAARELGVRTAGVFAPDDATCAHRWAVDEAHEVRPRPARGARAAASHTRASERTHARARAHAGQIRASANGRIAYLDADAIVRLARAVHADAIHPGYGFLSESSYFARACESAGVRFVGGWATACGGVGTSGALGARPAR